MVRKPDIEYVGKFYVYGSEAKKLAPEEKTRKARTILPLERLESIQQIRLDPVALLGIAVAVVMVVTMVIGAVNIRNAWQEYETMQNYVADLQQENVTLQWKYRNGYDLAEIEAAALALGMVPAEEVPHIQLTVTVPVVQEEPTRWEAFREYVEWFIDGLFA